MQNQTMYSTVHIYATIMTANMKNYMFSQYTIHVACPHLQYGNQSTHKFPAHTHQQQLWALHAAETKCYTSGGISTTASLTPLQPNIVGKYSAAENGYKLMRQKNPII